MKRKGISILLIITVLVTMVLGSSASVFAAVEQAKTPVSGATKWAVKPGGSMTPPTLYQDRLYVAAGRYVYQINKENGAVMKKSVQLAATPGYTTVPVTCADGKVLVPLSGGKVDILDASALTRIRTASGTDSGQMITPIVYENGYIYTGTYRPSGEMGQYMCIDVSSGQTLWTQENPHGFYWAGACIVKGYAVFGSEDGQEEGISGTAKLYSHSARTSETGKSLELSGSGDIRSTVVYDQGTDHVYFTSKAGYFYKVKVENDGALTLVGRASLGSASTSTPILYNGKAYVGTCGFDSLAGAGTVKRIDLNSMTVEASAATPGYVQGEMLLTTGDGTPYLYGAYNYPPGGISRINGSTMAASSFFVPGSSQRQYGLSRVICDSKGTIYYTNDSNYLMAVSSPVKITSSASKGGKITGSQTVGSGASSCSFSATPNRYYYVSSLVVDGRDQGSKTSYTFYNVTADHTIRADFKKVATPVKLKVTAGKKKATVKWKKASGVSGYQVYRATKKKGKYKKVKTLAKTRFVNKKLKRGKTYYYKVRAYKNVNGKKVYGAYSKIAKVKTK